MTLVWLLIHVLMVYVLLQARNFADNPVCSFHTKAGSHDKKGLMHDCLRARIRPVALKRRLSMKVWTTHAS